MILSLCGVINEAMIGGGVAGVLIGLFSLEAYTFAVPSPLLSPSSSLNPADRISPML
ncbi:MAG: hypothetical protein V8T10_00085 [Merdibacter sp.]